VWGASTGVEVMKLSHTDRVLSVAFSSNGTRIVSGSLDDYVRVWDASTGVELMKLGQIDRVNSVAFSSDDTRIVSGSRGNSVRVWDASTGVELIELKGHTSTVRSVAFSSDGRRVVSGSDDMSVRVWNVSESKLQSMIGCEHCIWNLADNSWIVSSQGQDHLMWVPWREVVLPQNYGILTISRVGLATVDFHQSKIGVDWIQCYTP
jgi:WD40 repeat protein